MFFQTMGIGRQEKVGGIIMSDRFNSGDEGKFYMAMYEKIISELQKSSCTSMMMSPKQKSCCRRFADY